MIMMMTVVIIIYNDDDNDNDIKIRGKDICPGFILPDHAR